MNLSEMKPFFDYVKNKKIFSENTVHSWANALQAISATLDEEEQKTEFVIENRDLIKNRLENGNQDINGKTVELYLQRGFKVVEYFQAWKKDRTNWEKTVTSSKAGRPKSAAKNKAETTNEDEDSVQINSFQERVIPDRQRRKLPIPTANGDFFEVGLPRTYTTSDIVRVAWGLAVYASDFDPETVLRRFGKPPSIPDRTHGTVYAETADSK